MPYAPLHTHSEHSALDGLSQLDGLFALCKEMGMDTVGINDHGSLNGLRAAERAAKAHGVRLMPGMEAYMAVGTSSRFDRVSQIVVRNDDDGMGDAEEAGSDGTKERRFDHLTILAYNRAGWHNLIRFHNGATEREAYWYKPRGDYQLLKEHSEGLVVFTGCLAGPVAGPLHRAVDHERRALLMPALNWDKVSEGDWEKVNEVIDGTLRGADHPEDASRELLEIAARLRGTEAARSTDSLVMMLLDQIGGDDELAEAARGQLRQIVDPEELEHALQGRPKKVSILQTVRDVLDRRTPEVGEALELWLALGAGEDAAGDALEQMVDLPAARKALTEAGEDEDRLRQVLREHLLAPAADSGDGVDETAVKHLSALLSGEVHKLSGSARTALSHLLTGGSREGLTLDQMVEQDHDARAQHVLDVLARLRPVADAETDALRRHGAIERAAARRNLEAIIDAVGAGNVYVEVMEHGIGAEEDALAELYALAEEYELPLVATNDSHYLTEEDAHAHDGFLCNGTQAKLNEPGRFSFNGSGYHMRSEEQMRDLRPEDERWQQAVSNSQAVADRLEDDTIPGTQYRLPSFPLPEGFDSASAYVRSLVAESLERMGLTDQVYLDRVETEMEVIDYRGFPDYFLINWDVINWAKSDYTPADWIKYTSGQELSEDRERKERYPLGLGRGSAAGSLVAYALGITGVDPIPNGLLFERFLEIDREGLPDIDTDYPSRFQGEIFRFLALRWGRENTARIGQYGTLKSKAALKAAGRVHEKYISDGLSREDAMEAAAFNRKLKEHVDRLSKLIPLNGASPYTLTQLEEVNPQTQPFWDYYDSAGGDDSVMGEVLDMARRFENVAGSPGKHPCGFVVSPEPLGSLVPLRMSSYAADADPSDPYIICWDGEDCEKLGLLKLDVLGLESLDILSQGMQEVSRVIDRPLHIEDVPHPDSGDETIAGAWELLRRGSTGGIFQASSAGMTRTMQSFGINSLADASAAVAAFRPGPMKAGVLERYAARKAGREPVDYDAFTTDPEEARWIDGVLGETYGLFLYQEQLMELGRIIAGFDASQRSFLRKAVSKKKKEMMDEVGRMLREGAPKELRDENGTIISPVFSVETAERTYEMMKGSAEYLFNKCISGDTEVLGDRGARWTVAELYRRLHGSSDDGDAPEGLCPACLTRPERPKSRDGVCGPCASWRYKFYDPARGLRLLSYIEADGVIRPARMVDVHRNGVREVFELRFTDGRAVKATGNHRFLTPEGYRRVDQLGVGDAVVSHEGVGPHGMSLEELRTTSGERISTPERKPWLPGEQNTGYIDGGFVKLKEWTERTIDTAACDECGRTAEAGRLERCHLDGDRRNNDPENLAWKCPSHHRSWDYRVNGRNRRWDRGHLAGQAVISSITPAGSEMTYDVEMAEGTDHNFVANGVVSHNSHSVAYGYLTYVSAWIKSQWPVEYGAAILSVTEKPEKRALAFSSLRTDGIEVVAPDINTAAASTAAVGGKVMLGLSDVKWVGREPSEAIVAARESGGPFTSLHDVAVRSGVGAGILQHLIEAGAMDAFGPRMGLSMIARAAAAHDLPVPDVEWDPAYRSFRQRRLLGISLGQNVLDVLEDERVLRRWANQNDLSPMRLSRRDTDRQHNVACFGVIGEWSPRNARTGRMANMKLEDGTVTMDAVLFPRSFAELEHEPAAGDVVCAIGQIKTREIQLGGEDEDGGEGEVTLVPEMYLDELIRVHTPEPTPVPGDVDFYGEEQDGGAGVYVAEPEVVDQESVVLGVTRPWTTDLRAANGELVRLSEAQPASGWVLSHGLGAPVRHGYAYRLEGEDAPIVLMGFVPGDEHAARAAAAQIDALHFVEPGVAGARYTVARVPGLSTQTVPAGEQVAPLPVSTQEPELVVVIGTLDGDVRALQGGEHLPRGFELPLDRFSEVEIGSVLCVASEGMDLLIGIGEDLEDELTIQDLREAGDDLDSPRQPGWTFAAGLGVWDPE